MTARPAATVQQHFAGREPIVAAIYGRLLTAARSFGPVTEDPKKTSIHLARRTAFAGVAARRNALVLTLKSGRDLRSKRIAKHERASANRWHLDVHLDAPEQVDRELIDWLRQAYDLSG